MLSHDLLNLAVWMEESMKSHIETTPEGQKQFLANLKKAAEEAAAMELALMPERAKVKRPAFSVIDGGLS